MGLLPQGEPDDEGQQSKGAEAFLPIQLHGFKEGLSEYEKGGKGVGGR